MHRVTRSQAYTRSAASEAVGELGSNRLNSQLADPDPRWVERPVGGSPRLPSASRLFGDGRLGKL
jgi:hypothetical protein